MVASFELEGQLDDSLHEQKHELDRVFIKVDVATLVEKCLLLHVPFDARQSAAYTLSQLAVSDYSLESDLFEVLVDHHLVS